MRSQAHTSPRTNLTLETDLKHVHPTPGDETIGTKKTKQTADLKAISIELCVCVCVCVRSERGQKQIALQKTPTAAILSY